MLDVEKLAGRMLDRLAGSEKLDLDFAFDPPDLEARRCLGKRVGYSGMGQGRLRMEPSIWSMGQSLIYDTFFFIGLTMRAMIFEGLCWSTAFLTSRLVHSEPNWRLRDLATLDSSTPIHVIWQDSTLLRLN